MKHPLILLVVALLLSNLSFAQSLYVTKGQVTTVYPLDEVGQMVFAQPNNSAESSEANDYGISIGETTYNVGEIAQITVEESNLANATVYVNYSANGAEVFVASDIANYLTITADGGNVSIVASDDLATEITYELTGSSNNASFYMDGSYKATLRLNNLTLNNPNGAAIDIACGKRINVEIPDGTTTTLTDGTNGSQKACLFINGHAEISGGGTLNLSGNTKHAYASDEYTEIDKSFGTLNILSSVSDGLHIQQYFEMKGGTVNISGAGGDCIDVGITKDATDENNGQILITNGNITLNVAADDVKGLKSDSAMTISGGTIHAEVSGLGTKGFSVGTDLYINQDSGNSTKITMNVTGTTYMPDDEELESKCRGIKIKRNFTFNGGTINMSVTGKKAKGISCDGVYTYISGTTNVIPE